MASAANVRAGGAFVELFADPRGLEKGLKAAQAKVASFGKAISGIGAKLGAVGASITAPILGGAKLFADAGSALNDMSQRTGISVEALSALGYAAKQSGSDLETVEGAVRKMQKALISGSEDNLKAVSTFEALGLSVEKLMQVSPEEQFNAIARAISQVPNPTGKAAAMMQIFGKSGTALTPMINELDELTGEAKRFGLVMSTETAKAADRLGDSMDLLHAVLGSVAKSIGAAVAPMLTEWSIAMAGLAKQVKDFIVANKPMIVTIFKVGLAITGIGTAFLAAGAAIGVVGSVFGSIAAVVGAIGAGFALLLSPIGLIIVGAAGMATYLTKTGKSGLGAADMLGTAFKNLLTEVKTTFGGIADALKGGDIRLAGQILWAGLKVEFQKGLNFVMGLWDGLKTKVSDVFTDFTFIAAHAMTGVAGNFKIGLVAVGGVIVDTFTWAIGQVKTAWSAFTMYLADLFDKNMAGIVTSLITIVSEIKRQIAIAKGAATFGHAGGAKEIVGINKEEEKLKAEEQATLEARVSGRAKAHEETAGAAGQQILANQQARQQQIGGIIQGTAGTQKALEDKHAADLEARRKASAEGLAAGAADLANAQKELAGLTGKAAEKAAAAKGLANTKQVGEGGGLSPEGIDKAMEKQKASVQGGFSAAGLAGLGAGESIQEEGVKEQKKTNDKLEKLTKTVEKKKAVFS